MPDFLAEKIIESVEHLNALYHRLMLVVGPIGSGKTVVLQKVSGQLNLPLININLELSKRMLDLTERQRMLHTSKLLDEVISISANETVVLDNLEMLFDISLKQNPLGLLQKISRNKTIIAAWNGSIEKENLLYAEPSHPEYRRYPIKDLMCVEMQVSA